MWIGAPELRVSVSVSDSLTGRRLYLPLVRVSIQTPPRARDNFVSKNLIMTVVDTKAAPRFEQRAVLWFIWSLVFVDRLKKRKEDTKKRVFCVWRWMRGVNRWATHTQTHMGRTVRGSRILTSSRRLLQRRGTRRLMTSAFGLFCGLFFLSE